MGFHHISAAGGIDLAVTGMTIVFTALVLVSLFIAGLPRVLPLINALLPMVEGHHGVASPSAVTASAVSPPSGSPSTEIGRASCR